MEMNRYNRGGKSLIAGDIGRMKVLRQHIALPGETVHPSVSGNIRLSGLRQQTSVYLHAKLECFAAPIRWFQSDWPDFIKEGVSTAKTVTTLTAPDNTGDDEAMQMGIGRVTHDFAKFYAQMPMAVWNEWFRFPEDSKVDLAAADWQTFFANQGKPCVNLPSALTRIRSAPSFDTTEYQAPSATVLDVRDIARYQARFHQAAVTDWTSVDRYNQFMRDIYNAAGNNEVDQVPHRLRDGAELSVMPRDMYASDGPSLGELMSLSNFGVDHSWKPYRCEEHMIFCYVLVLRFAPISDSAPAPGIYPSETDYGVYQGDPNIIAGERPVSVSAREVEDGDGTALGYLPYGWQLREGHNHVDYTVWQQNNFPLLSNTTMTAAGFRDASNIHSAFRSTALRHYFGDLNFDIWVDSHVPSAGQSITAGSDRRGPKGNHPIGGFTK